MDTSNGAAPHHRVSTHSHHHHRLGLLHISYSLLVFLVNGGRQYISKRSTFLHSKGNELFVTAKSQRKKMQFPPEGHPLLVPSYLLTATALPFFSFGISNPPANSSPR